MAVIVNQDMPMDQALRLLWRESNREGVIEKLKERRYYVKPSVLVHAVRRAQKKTKTRHSRYQRRFRNKGQ